METINAITFTVAKEDALAMTVEYCDNSEVIQAARRTQRIVFPLSIGVLGFMLMLVGGNTPVPYIGGALIIWAIIGAILMPTWGRSSSTRSFGRMLDDPSYQVTFGRYTVTASDDGLACSSPTGEGKYFWNAVSRVKLTPHHLFIFLAGASDVAIPRDQVPAWQIEELKEFAEARVHKAKSDRSSAEE